MAKKQTSPRAGVTFEKAVAELYQLLGARVTQNIEVFQKKVDILAEFPVPGTRAGHRVIVECKDEGKARGQNQRVMELAGLLQSARKAGAADSAELVTRVPWSEAAKGFARQSGVALTTYTDKVAQLIDFSRYLNDVKSGFAQRNRERPTEPPLAAYYIEPIIERITGERPEKIAFPAFLNAWLSQTDATHQVALLSGYGTGKTSFCEKLAYDLAEDYLATPREPGARIPILLDLREFTKTVSIEAFIASFLDQKCDVSNPRFRLFQKMNEVGLFLIICDGFDEMAARVDADTLEINIFELEKLIATPRSKLFITSRSEHFVSAEEERRLFRPRSARSSPLGSLKDKSYCE